MILQILLEEWNNSAILVVFAILSVPVILLQLLINFMVRIFPNLHHWMKTLREKKMGVFILLQMLLFLICTGIVLGLGSLLS